MKGALLRKGFIFLAICVVISGTIPINYDNEADTLRIVLTIDVSNSMEGDKISETSNALQQWILNDLRDDVELGVVQFASNAQLLSKLAPLSYKRRQDIKSIIPNDAQGEGLLDRGLQLAIEELSISQSGGIIILITDMETTEKFNNFDEIRNKIKANDIKVFTIAIGNEAKIDSFSLLENGGSTFNIRDEEMTSKAVKHALSEIMLSFETLISTISKTIPTIAQPTTTNMEIFTQEEVTIEITYKYTPTKSDAIDKTEVTTRSNVDSNVFPGVVVTSEPHFVEGWNTITIIGTIIASIFVIVIIILASVFCFRQKYKIVRIRGSYQLIQK